MYGYVRPAIPELKVREYDIYRSVYCGLCRALKKSGGNLSRTTLSYDMVFLCCTRMLMDKTEYRTKLSRCVIHPVKKRNIGELNEHMIYTACVSLMLLSEKISDDIKDEKGFRKARAAMAKPFVKAFLSRAEKNGKGSMPSDLKENISVDLGKLSDYEKSPEDTIGYPADCFGNAMGEVFSSGFSGSEKRILFEIGRGTGRFLYFADAIDDISEDLKKGRFNPIASFYGPDSLEQKDGVTVLRKDAASYIETAMILEIKNISKALALIDTGAQYDPISVIVNNIVEVSMPDTIHRLIYPQKKKGGKENE